MSLQLRLKISLGLIFITLNILPYTALKADVVTQTLENGLVATAEYTKGDADAPSILILHGFLQTRDSHTVTRLYTSLVDSGFSVLAPTLTLGINRRKSSLDCEAIHSHSMTSDMAEIDMWSKWLHIKSHAKVILIGHSAGSVQLLSYMGQKNHDHIDQGIYVSLSYFGSAPASHETPLDSAQAKTSLQNGKNKLQEFGLSYCKKYVTTPENYLSYYVWQPEKILTTMKKIQVPVSVIIGSEDQRISKEWVSSMLKNKIKILSVAGAGHFFDNEYEFDLQDTIETLLSPD